MLHVYIHDHVIQALLRYPITFENVFAPARAFGPEKHRHLHTR